MYLFFDTETTALAAELYAPPSDTANWPRIVQIAWALIGDDENEVAAESFLVRPDGFEIPDDAASYHGITTEAARLNGVDILDALVAFRKDADRARIVIAHNVPFDVGVVGAEFIRACLDSPLVGKIEHCTMRYATDFCQLKGRGGVKWPSLTELHNFLFDAHFDSAHDAMADVRACAKCFFELKRRGVIFGPDESDSQTSEDQYLFDEIYDLALSVEWFDTGRFVDRIYTWFQSKGTITDGQRSALEKIRDMLEEKAY